MIILAVLLVAWAGSLALGLVGASTQDETVSLILLVAGLMLAPALAGLAWLLERTSTGDGSIGFSVTRLGLLLTWPVGIGAWFVGKRLGRR